MLTFTERIRLRKRIWWHEPRDWRDPATYRRPLHRWLDVNRLRHRTRPLERWRCCEHWQRSLSNKWNAREFAQMHGVPVPQLYWSGRRTGALPLDELPDRFVIRPAFGSSGAETYAMVDGRDVLHERSYSLTGLRRELRRRHGPIARSVLLVEEFVRPEQAGRLQPIEYKCYAFRDRIAIVATVDRHGADAAYGYRTIDWQPFPQPISARYAPADPGPAPASLDEILALSRRLGTSYGTFVRVDFYATDRGPVFAEFSTTPLGGQRAWTPFAETYLGRSWEETYPDRV